MRADQPPSDPDQWLLPLAVDELGDALNVVRALTDEADATAVAARAALDDDPAYDGPAPSTADHGPAAEEDADRGSWGETISPDPINLDPPAGDAPAEASAQPAEAETPAEPAADERSAAEALPAAAMAAAVEAEPVAAPEETAVGAEVEEHEPETIRIGRTPAAAAASSAAAAADAAPAAATAMPAHTGPPAETPPGSGGGGAGRGDRRNLWLAAAFVGMIALAVAAVAVLLGTRSPSSKDVAGPAATPTASKSGSGFSMTLTAPPTRGGAKSSPAAKPAATRASAKPTPKPTAAAAAAAQCSGSGWQQRRLQSAISRITYDYGRLGIRVAAAPARDGVLAIGDKSTRVVTAYVRSCGEESAPLLAASVADQMAQLIDLQVLNNSERVDWLRRRGFAGGTTWDPDGLLDYASVFTRWQVGAGFWRSSLAPPSAAELEILKRWYAPN